MKQLGRGLLIIVLASLAARFWKGPAREEPQLAEQREKYLLSDEPAGAVSVIDAKASIQSQDAVTLIGRISAGEHTPWHDGKAAFLISDAAASIGEHGHHGECGGNCLFCKGETSVTDTLAIVQFLDDRGEVLSVDARDLLGVEENQLVVVRGRGAVDRLGNLVISADGIYVRR